MSIGSITSSSSFQTTLLSTYMGEIQYAILKNDDQTIIRLLNQNMDFSLLKQFGSRFFAVAALKGNDELVKKLIELKVKDDFVNTLNETSLHIASKIGHTEIVKLLLKESEESKSHIDLQNIDGQTPLHIASNTQITETLVKYGASCAIIDKNMHTPIEKALFFSEEQKIKVLSQNLSYDDRYAILFKYFDGTQLLQSRRSQVFEKNFVKYLFSPEDLEIAKSRKHNLFNLLPLNEK